MLVITNRIELADLQLTRDFAALPDRDGLNRWELQLPIDSKKIDQGLSLSSSLKPTVYCNVGRSLNWFDVPALTVAELDDNLWNTYTTSVVPFGSFTPYKEVAV
jgi:hypothetical protein